MPELKNQNKERNLYLNVDRTGIEPVTPTMSMWCSTAEPTILAVGK